MNKDDFIPMDKPKSVPVSLKITQQQYEKLLNYSERETRDDRWILYVEDDIIHCCRTWTNFEVFRAPLTKKGSDYFILTFDVEDNKEKYNSEGHERDIQSFTRIIAWIGLEVNESEIQVDLSKPGIETSSSKKSGDDKTQEKFIRCPVDGYVYDPDLGKCPQCSGNSSADSGSTSSEASRGTSGEDSHKKTLDNELEKIEDDIEEWKKIPPMACCYAPSFDDYYLGLDEDEKKGEKND